MGNQEMSHWSERAIKIQDEKTVNIPDSFQQDLEYANIYKYLDKNMVVLEIGCGNGYCTNIMRDRVKHIDAIDCSLEMVERARKNFGEQNNNFIQDDIRNPKTIAGKKYDAIVCVRVLINLSDLNQQLKALANMRNLLKPGGVLILLEGFLDGFENLSQLRKKIGMNPINPSKINFYSQLSDILPWLDENFHIEDKFHIGSYDFLTRCLYPHVVGEKNIKRNSPFVEKCSEIAKVFNPTAYEQFSRVRGFVCRLKS